MLEQSEFIGYSYSIVAVVFVVVHNHVQTSQQGQLRSPIHLNGENL